MHTSQSQRKILLLESPPSGSESMSLSSAVSDLLWAITTSFSTVLLQVDSKPLLPFAPSLWALPPSTLSIQSRADSSPVHLSVVSSPQWSYPFSTEHCPDIIPHRLCAWSSRDHPVDTSSTRGLQLSGPLQAVAYAWNQLGWEAWSDAGVKEDLHSGWGHGGERLFQAEKLNA